MSFERDPLRSDLIEAYKQIHKAQTGSEISEVHAKADGKVIVLKGKISLTNEEEKYLNSRAGKKLVSQVRLNLLEEAKPTINAKLSNLTGCLVCDSFTEIDLDHRLLQHTFVISETYENAI